MKLAACPDCGNACSLTAVTCPRCGRTMMPGDLSESNAIKPVDYSKFLNILIYGLAVICGVVGFLVATTVFWLSGSGVGFFGSKLVAILLIFIVFSLLGVLFGYVWDKLGWKLALSLASSTIIVWGFATLADTFSGKLRFEEVFQASILIIPTLAGSCLGVYFGAKYKQKKRINNGVVQYIIGHKDETDSLKKHITLT